MKALLHRSIEKIPIRVFDGERIASVVEPIITELSFELNVNGRDMVALACTGLYLEELATGWLRSEGIIAVRGDIGSMELNQDAPRASIVLKKDIAGDKFLRSIGSSGGRGVVKTAPVSHGNQGSEPETGETQGDVRVSPRQVLTLMRGLMQSAKIHDLTRGTHCSALADPGRILASREDIGRHNTIDMLGGYSLLNGIDCSDKILLTTGRVSSEIIVKACRIGVPFIISHSAATSRAVALARELGMSLVGYVRGGRFKIYAGEQRIAEKAGRKGAR